MFDRLFARVAKRRPQVSPSRAVARSLSCEQLERRQLLATHTVTSVGDVVDPDDGVLTLREAIELANETPELDTINFNAALASSTITLELGELEITQPLLIEGLGADQLTVDADQLSRVFHYSAEVGDLTINGLTIANGLTTADNVEDDGEGGIETTNSGGGIRFVSNGLLSLNNVVVTNNSTQGLNADGGGIYSVGDVAVDGSTISGNSTTGDAASGGGIFALAGDVVVSNSTVSGNSTAGDSAVGGGIAAILGDVLIENSTVSGNSTAGVDAVAGGIVSTFGDIEIFNSTISGNSTTGEGASGGGIYADAGLIVSFSTITQNSTAGIDANGGGIYAAGFGDTTIGNSIIAGNRAQQSEHPDISFNIPAEETPVFTAEYSLIGINAGTPLAAGAPDADGNLVGTLTSPFDPRLGPLADNGGPTLTHALLPQSPAIDAGDPAADAGVGNVPEFDQRGTPFTRVADGKGKGTARIDIGAFEVPERVLPKLAVYLGNTVVVDSNGNGSYDPPNFLGGDQSYTFGNTNDQRFAGQLGVLPTDVLALYGRQGNQFRFLFDSNGNFLQDAGDQVVVPSLQISGLAISGDFAPGSPGDEIGVFDGRRWYLDTNGNRDIDAADTVVTTTMRGYPVAGDFNADGTVDLATYQNDTWYLDFNRDGTADAVINFGAVGRLDRPVVADIDNDGTDDLGVWVPQSGAVNGDAEWRFLLSGGVPWSIGPDLLPRQVANAQFGNRNALPLVGQFGEPAAAAPVLVIGGPVTQNEGNTGTTSFTFPVAISRVPTSPVTVVVATADGTATVADSDYQAVNQTLTFSPGGAQTQFVTVLVNGDTKQEDDETFSVNLSNATGATITLATNTGTIVNDDAAPVLSIGNVSQLEGNTGTTAFTFPVTLSQASGKQITVAYATANGTATAPSDFAATSGTLTIAPGATTGNIVVNVVGDTTPEPNETFFVNLSNVVNATFNGGGATLQATGTILNDDLNVSITPAVSQNEGNTGTTPYVFTVTLSAAPNANVTVVVATSDGTATTADNDYQALSQTLTFTPGGALTQNVTVLVNGDTKEENNETFSIALSNASGASITTASVTGTIVNDDTPPVLSIGNVSLLEGNAGTTVFAFPVTLSQASGKQITVVFATANGTAESGSDYTATNGTLTIAAGATAGVINVNVSGDTTVEPNETFFVNLSNAVNVSLSGGGATLQATGTIENDDAEPPAVAATVTAVLAETASLGEPVEPIASAVASEAAGLNSAQTVAPIKQVVARPTRTDVAVSITAAEKKIAAGATTRLTITVANSRMGEAHNVVLSSLLPKGLTVVSQTQTAGPAFDLSQTEQGVSNTVESLPAGAVARFELLVRVDGDLPKKTKLNVTAAVETSSVDLKGKNNIANALVVASLPPQVRNVPAKQAVAVPSTHTAILAEALTQTAVAETKQWDQLAAEIATTSAKTKQQTATDLAVAEELPPVTTVAKSSLRSRFAYLVR